ncbi:uncharacterized protein RHOBADRAFT_66348 [Rhodotorula graminis WP1]|uniref:Extracellular membrane protein CFEM domain-containing protein n=1 Tax=Rhodotorula graminis (strain WP1) TaxID=578459 RepID=A0A194S3T7_RHOGW|nr:uncharacterized protein RHOBADRAFT_66348 [Rhodotorula graminis WP1]KPV75170.1 hypothetical protein RHOBADRAFT_66348 [Rhodotorula graminis WP1]
MVRAAVVVLALAASVCASAHGALGRVKRQSLSDSSTQAVEGLLDIAQMVLAGNTTTECNDWITSLQNCSNLSDETEVATCACGTDVLTQLEACAPVYGKGPTESSFRFKSFCTEVLPTLDLSNSTLSSAASSVAASATSAIDSLTSSAVSAASSASNAARSSASSAASSAAAGAQPSSASGSSGAGRTAVVGGLAGVVAIVAALAL